MVPCLVTQIPAVTEWQGVPSFCTETLMPQLWFQSSSHWHNLSW